MIIGDKPIQTLDLDSNGSGLTSEIHISGAKKS